MSKFRIKSADLTAVPEKNSTIVKTVLLPISGRQTAVFGLIRILGDGSEARQRLVNIVVEHLEHFLQAATEHKNIPRKFEQILQAINKDIESAIAESPQIPISDFHAVVGVQDEEQLFLSGIGKLSALFMHRTAKQRYVLYDLDKQLQEDQDWKKPFVTVLDGELHPGDVFYVATRTSAREISASELQDILVTLPPSSALPRVQQFLNRDTAYGAIAFQVKERDVSSRPKKINPLSSVESLTKTKETTASLLGEQKAEIGNAITRLTNPILKKLSSPGTKGAKTTLKRILKALIKGLAASAVFVGTMFSRLVAFIKSRRKTQHSKPEPKTERASLKERTGAVMKKLPKQSKLIGGIAVIVILLFLGTLAVSKIKKRKSEDSQTAKTVLLRIEEKKNTAEASLIYDDVDQAKTLVSESIALLETLPEDESIQDDVARLREELNQVLSQIRGINEVATVQLGDISSATSAAVTSVSLSGDILHAATDKNEILQYNELEQKWNKLEFTNGSLSPIALMTESGANFLVVDLAKNLGRADTTALTLNPITSGATGIESIEDISVYNNSLYVLSADAEQIVKMRPQGDGYDAGTTWIASANSDLSDAKAIGIDGNIYILTGTTIAKFSSGKEEAFSLEVIEPALSGAVDMWTDESTDYLYVLEPTQGRVIVYKKTGDLVTQYYAEAFKSGTKIIAREDQNSIIVATRDQVFNFPANHLLQ